MNFSQSVWLSWIIILLVTAKVSTLYTQEPCLYQWSVGSYTNAKGSITSDRYLQYSSQSQQRTKGTSFPFPTVAILSETLLRSSASPLAMTPFPHLPNMCKSSP